MRSLSAFFSMGVVVLGFEACGGTVTTPGDQGGSGAASGAGASQSSGTSTSTNASGTGATEAATTSTGTGVGGTAACDGFCGKALQLGCEAGDCVKQCSEMLLEAGDCAGELGALLACTTQLATSCDGFKNPPPGCSAQMTAFLECSKGDCGPEECSGSGSSGGQTECDCKAQCGSESRSVSCLSNPDGNAECSCFVNGQQVGVCKDVASSSCSVNAGCCQTFFM